uniref:SNF1-related protein kinase regulatory subunit beta-2-like isoform X2 n=1 Tax=Rhizophora mucronata TaxID=61149 RepID=A0A2P2IJ34_RHIMU
MGVSWAMRRRLTHQLRRRWRRVTSVYLIRFNHTHIALTASSLSSSTILT